MSARLLPRAALLALAVACAPANGPDAAPDGAPPPAAEPVAAAAAAGGAQPSRLAVRPGVSMLAERFPAALRGRRVGLITNHTGRDEQGRTTIDLLAADERLRLVALYSPEHGIRGTAAEGETVDSSRDARTGLPIHSLYGATRRPTPAMLEGVEALVFDIQDVGARQYTYVYTMAYAMEAAKAQGIPFVVLDRPNPVRGDVVEGGILDSAYASFVGLYPIASRHGMTAGELARYFNAELGIGADLTVVTMDGWRRDLWWDETGLDWIAPSPNLPRLESAIHYPGTVYFEGMNLSEGRISSHPFQQTGAPWLRAAAVIAAMDSLRLPGVRFEAVRWTPPAQARHFPGVEIPGVRLHVTDRATYRPLPTALHLIATIRRLHPGEFRFIGPTAESPDAWWLDRLAGTDRLRRAIEGGTLPALLAEWEREAAEWERRRRPYLLY